LNLKRSLDTERTPFGGNLWLGSLKVSSNVTVRHSVYDFLFTVHSNYLSILCYFSHLGSYLLKAATFFYPMCT